MTDKELVEVSNRAWNAFVDQLPKEFTGRDLMMIMLRFVVNIANAVKLKPTTVCAMMYDKLNADRQWVKIAEKIKNVSFAVGVLATTAGAVVAIAGAFCGLFNYEFGSKLFYAGVVWCLAIDVLSITIKAIDRRI